MALSIRVVGNLPNRFAALTDTVLIAFRITRIANVLNAHPIVAATTNFGSALGRPTQALQPRILTIGAQLHF